MPLVRFEIRNELSLGGPKLNRSSVVEDEEPKAILGAVEVAGLVGILRQLGDLAEFSAEVFNGIQEEVTVTASRCQKLTSRVKRIESALSPLEKAVLSQTSHIHFAYRAGCEWHPRIRNGQRHFVQSDLPLCVMETYEQCRDPPPLHLLDRFDLGGPGSCLRKYSDPTFFRKELSNPSKADDVKVQRDQAHRKRKKKRIPQRNICRSRAVSVSASDETIGTRLSFLTDDKQATSESTSTVDMPRSSNMQDLSDIVDLSHLQGQSDAQEPSEAQVQSDFQESSKPRDSVTGSGYIEYVINQSPVNKPDVKLLDGFLSSLQPSDRICSALPEGCIEVVDDNILYSLSEDIPTIIVCDEKRETLESRVEKNNKYEEASEIHESKFGPETPDRVRQNKRDFDRTYSFFDEADIVGEKQSNSQANSIDGKPGVENQDFDRMYSFFDEVDIVGEKQSKIQAIENEGENKSEQESEADEFLDARNTIDSESESELDGVPKPKLEHYFGDISTYCSEDANSDNNDGSEDIPYEPMAEDPRLDDSLDESCSYFPGDANDSCLQSDPICGKTLSHDEKPKEFVAMSSLLLDKEPVSNELQGEHVAAHPLLSGDCTAEKISFEEPIASCPSLEDDVPAEKILPEQDRTTYLSLIEAVPHDKLLPEESVTKYPSLAEVVPNKKMLPEKPLPKIPSLVEAVPDNMRTQAEEPDSIPKAAQDDNTPPGFLDSTNLSVAEGVSQEQISLEEFVGMHPCLAETIPDERFLTEEHASTCVSLTKAMPIKKVFPEKPLEAHHSFAELPKEKIWLEKSDEATHPSCIKAAPEENISAKVLDSTNLSVAEAVPREKISLDEVVGIDKCLAEAFPDERTEEPVTTCLSLKRAVAIEKVLPEEPFETYPSLAELTEEEILHEEADDATHPSFSQAVSDEKVSPEVLDPTYLSVAEVVPQEPISLDEVIGIYPCLAGAVPDETTCLSLKKPVTTEKVLPEELTETYSSLTELPEENNSHGEGDRHPSFSQAVSDEKISPEVLDSTNFSLEEAVTPEKIFLEECVGVYPCLVEAVPDERGLPEEPATTYMSSTKVVPIEKLLPDEPLEAYASLEKLPKEELSQEKSDDATHPSCAKTESDENVSPEVRNTNNLCVAEAISQEQISLEKEFFGIDPCLGKAFPDERVLPEEPVTTCLSLTKAEPIENFWPEEPLEVDPYLEELPEENILQEVEPDDATHPSLSEAVGDENILTFEGPGSTYPSSEKFDLHEKISHEELVGTNPFLEFAVPNERSFPNESGVIYQSSVEAVSKEKNLPEEPLATYPPLAEVVFSLEEPDATCPPFAEASFDENISDSEAPGSTTEAGPPNKTLPKEPVDKDMSLAEAVFVEKISGSEAHGSTTEAGPHNKSFPEEHVATDISLIAFDENISDSKAPCSTTEAGSHNKSFHEEHVPTDMSLAEAVFVEKISGSEASGSTAGAVPLKKSFPEELVAMDASLAEAVFDEKIPGSEASVSVIETGPHNKTFPEEPVATSMAEPVSDDSILPKEPAAGYLDLAEGIPDQKVFLDDAAFLSFAEAIFDQKFSPDIPDPTYPSLSEPEMPIASQSLVTDLPAKNISVKEGEAFDEHYTASDVAKNQKSGFLEPESADRTSQLSCGTQETLSNDAIVEPVSIWSNGGLLGLAPSKPPVYAEPNSVSEHIQNEINEASVLATRKQESSSRPVEDTERSSRSLVVSDHMSQQQSNMLSHSNGSLSHLQSTATSFKVFGLSHRLLMAGFRGNSSSTCKFESIPTTSYGTKVAAIEETTQQTPRGSSFQEKLDYESSLFGSPTSSPPVEHMKISFNPIDTCPLSKLKLRIPCQSQRTGENTDMFPSFQLVPEASNSNDDDNSDIFSQASPCVSDNCLSDSELWESDGSPRRFVSSLGQDVGERSRHGEIGSFSGSFLDLPCFDAGDHHQSTSSTLEQEQEEDHKLSVLDIIRDWPPNQPNSQS